MSQPYVPPISLAETSTPKIASNLHHLTNFVNSNINKSSSGPYVFLSSFGVTFDGVTDDTAALNAAFASLAGSSGTIVFDKIGFCKTTSTVLVGSNTYGVTSFINIYSPFGPNASGISYKGSPGSLAALQIQKVTFSTFENFRVGYDTGGAPGATVGIRMGGQGGADQGDACHGLIFSNVFVVQFGTGIIDGNAGGFSEVLFNNLNLIGNTTGFTTTDFNTLDFTFNDLQMGGNGVGIDAGVSNGFEVFGGSSSANTIDFQSGAEPQTVTIVNFRNEVCNLFYNGVSQGGSNVVLISCNMLNPVGGVGVGQVIGGTYSSLVVEACNLQGTVIITEFGNLRFTNNALTNVDATSGLPFTLTGTANFGGPCNAICRGNYNTGNAFVFQDFDGDLSPSPQGTVASVRYEPVYTRYPHRAINFNSSYGTSWLSLNHVRSLSEASIPGAIQTSTSPFIGTGNPGQNLRVQTVFSSTTGTAAFTFQRTITVTCFGGLQMTSTGLFLPTDAGKPIVAAGHGNSGQTDWYGYCSSVTDASNILVQSAAPQTNFNASNVSAVFGANEPDGHYMVAGLVGNAKETFWVTTATSTGFTVNSSISTSTATVTALIVR